MSNTANPVKDLKINPVGDSCILVELGDSISPEIAGMVQGLSQSLSKANPKWLIEFLPSYTAMLIYYDQLSADYSQVKEFIEGMVGNSASGESKGKTVRLPVLYGGEEGPDLENVAKHNSMSVEKVIEIHTSRDYLVYMLGFSPGFPYLGGMDEAIACPRLDSPRLKVPAGSVGIAGKQTGVYPQESPGGWQLIGNTPTPLFAPDAEKPFPISAGDSIRFVPVEREEYEKIKGGEKKWEL